MSQKSLKQLALAKGYLEKPNHNQISKKGERNMERIKNFFKDESGAAAVEYGLLVALIACAIIGAVTLLGSNLNTTFNNAATTIGNAGT
jgi:pilus assembly protein Flp/PilA